MPEHEPLTVLLINDLGEEVKLVTLSFRGFFPGCRVEVAYSLEEALQWTPRAGWHLILVDERLTASRSAPIFPELKRLAPYATLVLQTERSDSTAAINALQAGADFLLYKKSPAFLTELMLYTKGAVHTRDLRMALERTQERHSRLVDTLADVLYELDAEGRFVYLSPSVTPLLGYAPEELTGLPYSTVLAPDQLDQARHRFDDRRTGVRAARRVEVGLMPKPAQGGRPSRIPAELSAKGLYDAQRRYLGTLGLLRDLSGRHEREHRIQRLEQQLEDKERLVQAAQRLSSLSAQLQAPLNAVLSQSQQLLSAMQAAKLDQQAESLLRQATEAVRRGAELAQTARAAGETGSTIHAILDHALATTTPPLLETDHVERRYGADVPPFTGDAELAARVFRTLLSQAQRYLTAVGSRHRLRVSTAAVGPAGETSDQQPALSPPVQATEIRVCIEETAATAAGEALALEESGDLFEVYRWVHQLGGRLDFQAPASGLLSMIVWLPIDHGRPAQTGGPLPPTTVTEATSRSSTPETVPPEAAVPTTRPSEPLRDRRQERRVSVHVPAKITIGNVTRDGTMTWLGLGGASLEVDQALPPVDEQAAYVALKTAVGLLELQAIAHERGRSPGGAGPQQAVTRLALRFTGTGEMERQILGSLLEEARERRLSLTLETLLSLPEEQPGRPSPEDGEPRGQDHREALRVRVALPARIETPRLDATAQRPLALMVNLSRGGAALQMKDAPGAVGEHLSLHFSATGSLGQPRAHEPEAPEAVLAAQIVWTAPDHSAPSELRPAPSEPGRRLGVRFVHLRPFAEREINRAVAQHVGSSMDLEGIAGRSSIVSARRECRNARHQLIAVTDDHARHQISPATPVVIVVPGFGKTQTDYLALSFFLAANRLRVLRYDHTNHVGHSDGDMLQTTLRSMQVDLEQVLDFARTTWPTAPLTIVAEDVGARVALRVLSQAGLNGHLLLVNPVLDLHAALQATYQQDVLANHAQGLRRGAANLWGLNVNLDQFLGDALAGDYQTLARSAADIAALETPPVVFTTPHPSEPAQGQVEPSIRSVGSAPAVVALEADLSSESPTFDERHRAAFQAVYKQIAAYSQQPRTAGDIREVPLREVHRQDQLEQERLRIRHHVSQSTRNALWVAHTAHGPQIGDLHDYGVLREELYRRLLPLEPGAKILDLGCGQGDVARVILTNRAYALAHRGGPPQPPLRYVGLGHSQESVAGAQHAAGEFRRELAAAFSSAASLGWMVETDWVPYDWDSVLPFAEQSFDRIICHLSLCFSPSPLRALRDALRVLAPQGTLLVTSLLPHTDLSVLYRRHLRAAGQDEFNAPGQIVLHYLGRLREAIRHGLLHRYEREDFDKLLRHAGATPVHIRPALDGQLLVAVARKGKSPG